MQTALEEAETAAVAMQKMVRGRSSRRNQVVACPQEAAPSAPPSPPELPPPLDVPLGEGEGEGEGEHLDILEEEQHEEDHDEDHDEHQMLQVRYLVITPRGGEGTLTAGQPEPSTLT